MTKKVDAGASAAGEEHKAGVESYVERRARELRESSALKTASGSIPNEEEDQKPETVDATEEDNTEVVETEKAVADDSEEGGKTEESGKLDLSQVDYDNLNDESAEELGRVLREMLGDNAIALSKGLGSGVGQDIAKLRKRAQEAEAERDKVLAGLENVSPQSNAFSSVTDPKELDAIESNIVALYDKYDKIAIRGEWETDEKGNDGVTDGGKFYPKEDVIELLDRWKIELREIPKQRQALGKRSAAKRERDRVAKKLASDHDWFGNEDSEQSQKYSELMSDESVSAAMKVFPYLEPILMEAFAAQVSGGARKRPTIPLRGSRIPAGGGSGSMPADGSPGGSNEAERNVAKGKFTIDDLAKVRAKHYQSFFRK